VVRWISRDGIGERIYGLWLGGYEETGYRGEDIWAVVGWI
jgi:hypothetical protein